MLQAIIRRIVACLVIHGSIVEHHAYPFRLALRVSTYHPKSVYYACSLRRVINRRLINRKWSI